VDEKTYTTTEAAAKIGVSYQTLHNWVNSNLVPAPKMVNVGRNSIYLWTKADVERARKLKGTLKAGRKAKEKLK
jgi:DNA-binding transcriptional MerR regulator